MKNFIEFLTAKGISEEDFNAKSEAEKLALQKEYTNELHKSFSSELAKRVNKEQFDELQTKVEGMVDADSFDAVKSLASKLEKELEAVKEKQNAPTAPSTPKTFAESVMDAFKANEEQLNKLANKQSKEPVNFVVKAPVTVGLNNTVEAAGSESQVSVTANTGIVSNIRKRMTRYLSSGVSVGNLAGANVAMWMEEVDEQGTPIFTAESATKPQISSRWEERNKKARKIPAYAKVSTEFMRNLPSLVRTLESNVLRRVDLATEGGLFTGSDTGNELAGLSGYATAYDGGGLNAGASPTYADVIRGLALQVEKAHGEAGAVFVRPEILAEMDVEKGTDGHYVLPPFRSPSTGNEVAGVRLISTTAVNAISGVDFIGGDLSAVNVMFTDQLSIQVDRSGDDFINNQMTILAEQELVQFVSANDTQVIVKGDMTSAIATITST